MNEGIIQCDSLRTDNDKIKVTTLGDVEDTS